MRTAIIAAGLALAAGLGAAAPAEAQYYGHHDGGYRHDGYRGGGYGRGYGDHRGYGYRGYGHGYGRGRYVCTYRHGFRQCFRRF